MLLTQLRVRDDPPSSRASHGIFQGTLEVLKGLEHQHLVLGHVLALKNPSDEQFEKNGKQQFCMQQKSGTVRTTTSWDIAPMVILMDTTSSWMDAFSLFGTAVPPVFGMVLFLLWRCLKLTSTEQVKSKPSDTFNFARIQEFQMSHMNQVITAQFSK